MKDLWEGLPCSACGKPTLRNCNGGVREYSDGSSIACPNWNMKLNEIGGMLPEEAEQEERYRSQFR